MRKSLTWQSLLPSYEQALWLYLKKEGAVTSGDLSTARALGRQAVRLGLETLDLATLHAHALQTQDAIAAPSAQKRTLQKRSRAFFAECNYEIEKIRPARVAATLQIEALTALVKQHRSDLRDARRLLAKERTRSVSLEKNLGKSQAYAVSLGNQSRQLQKQMSLLSRRSLNVLEEERSRISRELHDVIAQLLAGINLRLVQMDIEVVRDSRSVSNNLKQTQRLVEKSMGIVHRFARELRPAALDDLGLVPALRSLVNDFSRHTGLEVDMTIFSGVERLKSDKRTVLYRVAQESLVNIRKHADASRVTINILHFPTFVRMVIHDDGKSFDVNRALSTTSSKGLGLLGIRERVGMVGGTFSIHSAPGSGTTVRAEIPVAPPKLAKEPVKEKL